MLYTDILTKNRDFQLCYQKGRSIISRFVIVYARKNRFGINRLGITTGKKVGNAVARSRARRLIRQAWRENEPDAPVGLDIVIVARAALPGVKTAKSALSRKRLMRFPSIPQSASPCCHLAPEKRQPGILTDSHHSDLHLSILHHTHPRDLM